LRPDTSLYFALNRVESPVLIDTTVRPRVGEWQSNHIMSGVTHHTNSRLHVSIFDAHTLVARLHAWQLLHQCSKRDGIPARRLQKNHSLAVSESNTSEMGKCDGVRCARTRPHRQNLLLPSVCKRSQNLLQGSLPRRFLYKRRGRLRRHTMTRIEVKTFKAARGQVVFQLGGLIDLDVVRVLKWRVHDEVKNARTFLIFLN
jgi:hypothetical protein